MWQYQGNVESCASLEHIGIIGMKWGVRRGRRASDKIAKKVTKSMKKFDRGSVSVSAGTFRNHSRTARKQTYKADKRIHRMNKYLSQVKNESANNIILKWQKNPEKVAKVKEYLRQAHLETKRLSEIRSGLTDIKLDLL